MGSKNLKSNNDFVRWLFKERYQILITLFAAILPTILTIVVESVFTNDLTVSGLISLFRKNGSLIQSLFIFITLFVLVNNMVRTNKTLEETKELVVSYIEKNTSKRYRSDKEKYYTFDIVSTTVKQFYIMWIVVWVFWFIYYTGSFIMGSQDDGQSSASIRVFNLTFDFLSSSAIYIIYLILTDVTVKIEERRANGHLQLWYGSLLWILIFSVWLSLLVKMLSSQSNYEVMYQYNNLLMSAFSSVSFVLVLGKLNSNYLQIPRVFLFIMYAYAIIQAYVPFRECTQKLSEVGSIINGILPFATLIGKVFVMLALCWVADKKRLIFFIIHESVALDETPMLLDELDSDPVEF